MISEKERLENERFMRILDELDAIPDADFDRAVSQNKDYARLNDEATARMIRLLEIIRDSPPEKIKRLHLTIQALTEWSETLGGRCPKSSTDKSFKGVA